MHGEIRLRPRPDHLDPVGAQRTNGGERGSRVRELDRDTTLKATGDTATRWMAMAQCFAGPPEDPPPPGTRFLQRQVA